MPASKKKPAARKKKPARRSTPPFALPVLEQRQLDLIGLALVGLGLFFASLVYFGWDGGRAGSQAVEGLRWLLGAGHYLVPAALAGAGAIVMLRPVLPAVRPFRSGAICVFLAVTLGLSAGTVGPGGMRPDWWDAHWVKTRGGMVGETLDWAVATFLGNVGAHILAVFLFLAGVLLLTGASIAGVIKFTSDSVSSTTRELRGAVKKAPRPRRPAREDLETLERSTRVRVQAKRAPVQIEEPPEFDSLWDAEEPEPEPLPEPEAVPELERLAEDPPEDEPGVTRGPQQPVEPEQLTPQGRYRSEVTDSPDFVWEL